MNVEAQGVALALSPRHNARGAQRSQVGNARQWVAAVPVVEESLAEEGMSDALQSKALGLRGARQVSGGFLKGLRWNVWQAYPEFVDAF